MYTLKPHEIQRMKELYPPGTRVELLQMGNDPNPVPPGSKGTVDFVDDIGSVFCSFDNGRSLDIPGTAAAQAEFCYNNGFNVGKDELQPGDLIFWSAPNKNSTRWNKIHHVGIYVGDGMIVDASSSKGRVVYREIWGSEPTASGWTIKGGGRPVSN